MFHCVQRCVRRAWLCGVDKYTDVSFEHRKRWVEDRIAIVGECFAVAIHAYAVMSNHLHLVLEIDPLAPRQWRDEDVARRWVRLFPPREVTAVAMEAKCQSVMNDPMRIDVIRQRLGDLSWLMKCLAEPIARRANAEDFCKGRFWEGRFKSQALKDEKALLAAMAYVDLNPIRAGMTDRLAYQQHTSVSERMRESQDRPPLLDCLMQPWVTTITTTLLRIRLQDYLELVEWTGRQLAGRQARGRLGGSTADCQANREEHQSLAVAGQGHRFTLLACGGRNARLDRYRQAAGSAMAVRHRLCEVA